MSLGSRFCSQVFVFALALAGFAGLARPIAAQSGPAISVGSHEITGLADDWSHHRHVFSNPGSEEDAIKSDRYDEWLKIVNDPRYVMQQLRRGLPVQGPAAADAVWLEKLAADNRDFVQDENAPPGLRYKHRPMPTPTLKRDWNVQLSTTAAPSASAFPAKWSNNITTASCSGDFVVYPVGQGGVATHASIIAYYNLYSGCGGTVPEVDWAYNTGGAVTLSPVFALRGNQMAFIQTTGSGSVTASLTNGSKSFTVTTGSLTTNEVGSLITGMNIPAGDTIATVTGTTTGTLTTAASGGGSHVLTITGVAQLVLLTAPSSPPGTGTLAVPIAPTAETASNYYNGGSGCTAPCSYTATLNGSPTDTLSNPYYDIGSDTLYVGDSVGQLHKFNPVFNGVPAEDTSPWPVQMNHGSSDAHQLASPIYDEGSGNVFVGSSNAAGGYFYAVSASTGTINAFSAQLDATNGIMDAPLVDSSAGKAYVFVGRDTNTTHYPGIYQFATSASGWGTLHEATLGTTAGGLAGNYEYAGTFDNTYFSSSDWTNPTGYIYACSTIAASVLYQVKISSNALSTVVTGPQVAAGGHCSSVSEFYNNYAQATAATGSLTIATDPKGWTSGSVTVTVGTETYTFVTTVSAKDEVQISTSGNNSAANHEDNTAKNLAAVVNNDSTLCGDSGCVFASQTANTSATASIDVNNKNEVDLTATILGTASDFAVSTNTPAEITQVTASNGSNGSPADLLFLSVYEGNQTGCTNSANNGCMLSFNVSSPVSFTSATTALGAQTLASPAAASTGGAIIDNSALNTLGVSQIYFVTQNVSGSTACVTGGAAGVCAIQASQTAP